MIDTGKLFRSVGFIVHPEKSVLDPTHCIQYLGVIIDSVKVTVTLTPERIDDLIACCKAMIRKSNASIRDVAKVIGKIVAAFPAMKYGPPYYWQLENEKKKALAQNKGNLTNA